MFQRILDLEYDKIVIGSDINAFSYAYVNKCTVLYLTIDKPYAFDEKEEWKLQNYVWQDLGFMLSYSSYAPFADKISSIRIENENLLSVTTKNGLMCKIKFNELIISNDKKIDGLPAPKSITNTDLWVIDTFDVICGSDHPLSYINGKDDFVKKVYFFKSKRIGTTNRNKDAACVSKINQKNIDIFEYSHICSRNLVKKMMKKAGIVGRLNGVRFKRRPIDIKCSNRYVYPLGKNVYDNLPKNISILYDDWKTILITDAKQDEYIDKLKTYYGITF